MNIPVFLIVLLTFISGNTLANHRAAQHSNKLIHILEGQSGPKGLALSSIIGNRCNRYMRPGDEGNCKKAVNKMIDLLDYDIIFSNDLDQNWKPKSFVFVAFKKNFLQLMRSPKTTEYLNDLNQQLYKFLVHEKEKINIWNITKEHYKTDFQAALVIATLFQDTSIQKLHLAYLEKSQIQGDRNFLSNKELLGRVIDTINLVLDASDNQFQEIFYPNHIAKYLNRNIYHFYVPLFLSMSLKNNGTPNYFSYAAALMLTLTYEFVSSSQDYRYLLKDPERIDTYSQAGFWKLKDIYAGHCGSHLGSTGINCSIDFNTLRERFARSTKDGVSLLLGH